MSSEWSESWRKDGRVGASPQSAPICTPPRRAARRPDQLFVFLGDAQADGDIRDLQDRQRCEEREDKRDAGQDGLLPDLRRGSPPPLPR